MSKHDYNNVKDFGGIHCKKKCYVHIGPIHEPIAVVCIFDRHVQVRVSISGTSSSKTSVRVRFL